MTEPRVLIVTMPEQRYVMQMGDGVYWTYGRIVCLCGEYHVEWRRL